MIKSGTPSRRDLVHIRPYSGFHTGPWPGHRVLVSSGSLLQPCCVTLLGHVAARRQWQRQAILARLCPWRCLLVPVCVIKVHCSPTDWRARGGAETFVRFGGVQLVSNEAASSSLRRGGPAHRHHHTLDEQTAANDRQKNQPLARRANYETITTHTHTRTTPKINMGRSAPILSCMEPRT